MTHTRTTELTADINPDVITCRRCPRLVDWRERIAVEKRRQYQDNTYWGKAVPSFGAMDASLLIIGLAPAAHGANRTGRMFTGDRSGDWLYGALHRSGFANQGESTDINDGLRLINCRITAVAHCAPPQNKVTAEEITNCRPFLIQELQTMTNLHAVLCLGKLAFDATLRNIYTESDTFRGAEATKPSPKPVFGHGTEHLLPNNILLIASYHPSQQNTFTKRLTEPMFDAVFTRLREHLDND